MINNVQCYSLFEGSLVADENGNWIHRDSVESDLGELKSFRQIIDIANNALKEGAPANLEQIFEGNLASAILALMFAGEFVRHGGKNFLELSYNLEQFGMFTVTVQKVEGVTPCERIAELEKQYENRTPTEWAYNQACNALNKHRSDLKRATDTLTRLGYTDCGGELWKPPIGEIPAWIVDLEHVAYIHSEGDYLDSQEVIEAIEKAGGTVKRGDL